MKGICILLLAFLLGACSTTEPIWQLEIKTPTADLMNSLPMVEDNLLDSDFSVGYTMFSNANQDNDRLLTQADIDTALNSKFNLDHFSSLTTLPIYHKTTLTEEEMRKKADLLSAALNVEILNYDYFEPLDFHAEDFVIAHETELMSTQRELLAVFAQGNILIKQNGSIAVELSIPYSEDFQNDKSEHGVRNAVQFIYDRYLKGLVDFKNPVIQIDASTHLNDDKIQTVYHSYIYNETMGSLTDQLLAQAYQRIDVEFDEVGMSGFTISSFNGVYTGNAVLLDPYEALVQIQLIDSEYDLPIDIRAIELYYAYQDYQYDVLPIYQIYGYDIHGQGVIVEVPAVTVDAELVFEAPHIYTELHLPLHYNCIYY